MHRLAIIAGRAGGVGAQFEGMGDAVGQRHRDGAAHGHGEDGMTPGEEAQLFVGVGVGVAAEDDGEDFLLNREPVGVHAGKHFVDGAFERVGVLAEVDGAPEQ
ncbi:MAG: hypothetical protein ACO31E_12440 [Phycisphaerales bacterium]